MNLITDIFTSPGGLAHFFIKSFAIVLSAIYLIYALVLVRQVSVMLRAIQRTGGVMLRALSYIQVIAALLLLTSALAFL